MTKNYQHVLALALAVNEIDENPTLLPNVSLGVHIYDSYFDARMTYQAILRLLSRQHTMVPNYKCGTQKLMAVIGGLQSETSIHIATILGIYLVPQVGYNIFGASQRIEETYTDVMAQTRLSKAILGVYL